VINLGFLVIRNGISPAVRRTRVAADQRLVELNDALPQTQQTHHNILVTLESADDNGR
jgi:hypothetical protein